MDEKLLDFIREYLNTEGTGDNSANKGECVGLIECWTDKLGLPHTYGNAKDLAKAADKKFFDVIVNDPKDLNQFPVPGDILVYGSTWGNGFGHTGVVIEATGNSIVIFEQNNPSGHAPTVNTRNTYGGVTSWLHPKIQGTEISVPSNNSVITDQTILDTPSDGKIEFGVVKSLLSDRKRDLEALQGKVNDYLKTIADQGVEIAKLQSQTIPNNTNTVYVPVDSKVPKFIRQFFGDTV